MTLQEQQASKDPIQVELNKVLSEIAKLDPTTIGQNPRFGVFGFQDGVPLFEKIRFFFRRFSDADCSFLPENLMNDVLSRCLRVHAVLQTITEFNPEDHPEPGPTRDKHFGDLEIAFGDAFVQLSPFLTASGREDAVVQRRVAEAEERLGRIRALGDETETKLKQATETVAEAQRTAGSAGVAKYSVYFEREAAKHRKASVGWLITTAVLASVAIGVSIWSVSHALSSEAKLSASIPGTMSKIALLALFYYAVVWAGRVYRAERHNAVINRHRHNALQTFETFRDAATDDATRNAVLLQATESIFGHQPSGFSDPGKDTGNSKVLPVFPNLPTTPSD